MDTNDATNLRALLDQLRDSPAWQQTIGGTTMTADPADANPPSADSQTILQSATPLPGASGHIAPSAGDPVSSTNSVASLLSQLQNASAAIALHHIQDIRDVPASGEAVPTFDPRRGDSNQGRVSQPSAAQRQDLRACTYPKALSIIGKLSEDENFVARVLKLKEEQSRLEKRLWEEREAIQKRHQEKVHVARTKANMIGVQLTKFEADNMTEAFRRELERFDAERVLPAWEGFITKQQTALEALGVPTMFPTRIAEDRKRQQQVAAVLSGVVMPGSK